MVSLNVESDINDLKEACVILNDRAIEQQKIIDNQQKRIDELEEEVKCIDGGLCSMYKEMDRIRPFE